MDNKDNYLITPEATNEPGTNFDDILNNAPMTPPVPVPEVKPLDKVRERPRKKRSRELER
ncbi:MAG TPA: DUF4316 domain-containing protein [Treponema sp.]|nr:DUF4316 domain-containing protein [Treponema sp.]